MEGRTIQGWILDQELGRGADGIVYGCHKDDFKAAIKVFFPAALAKNGISGAKERLELQLALRGAKHHPNLVEIFEGGEVPDLETLYLVMEFVPGTSLDKLYGRIPSESVPELLKQLASAAQFLENEGLVHRDIKPANIVISDDYLTLTLLDLGIVHQVPEDENAQRLKFYEIVEITCLLHFG